MALFSKAPKSIDYLGGILKEKARTITRVNFWKIPHSSGKEDVRLKIGRYSKTISKEDKAILPETLESLQPKSELTLDNEEFQKLLTFISENYEPFKKGLKNYITINEDLDQESIHNLKNIFNNPDKEEVLGLIARNEILPNDLILGLQTQKRVAAVKKFEKMLTDNLAESEWQKWFTDNDWVLGSEFVKILDERSIDTDNITDYLMQAYDGFLDIIEIKKPSDDLKFWADAQDHGNYVPSNNLVKAITQATTYIYNVEREANSLKFLEKVENVKTIKPRCILIFGRSNDWNPEQKEAYRILNSSYHNLTITTYDHVLDRAKRMLGIEKSTPKKITGTDKIDDKDIPF